MLSVRGHFTDDGWRRPLVRARVAIPRLAVSAFVPFLVDTGADRTAIHWDDRQILADAGGRVLPPDAAFPDEDAMSGISGQRVRYGLDEALLAFRSEQGPTLVARLSVGVALDRRSGIPSLLGRDFFERFRLEFDMPADRLVITQPR